MAYDAANKYNLPTAFTERRTEEAKRIRRETGTSPRRAKELVPRTDGKMNCLTATYSQKEHNILDNKLIYRKLTPTECARLQTFPDNYCQWGIMNNKYIKISETQQYKAYGNSWTVEVIVWIFKQLEL